MSSTASISSRDNGGGGSGSGSGSGSGTALSNDALYAPLSTFAEFTTTSTTLATTSTTTANIQPTPQKQKQQQQLKQHSLALQTSSSLRESSLLTFLSSSICTNLKTCHSQEYALYRDLGEAFSKYGTGDGNHDGASYSNSIRSLLENKLSNRSLVLVGGGVHTTSNNTLAARVSGARGGKQLIESGSGVGGLGNTSTMTATVTSSIGGGSKRVRKRVGGNGIFGCISNKRRKKILNQKMVPTRGKNDEHTSCHDHQIVINKNPEESGDSNVPNPKEEKEEPSPTSKQQQEQSPHENVQRQLSQDDHTSEISSNVQEKNGSVIEELCKMWIHYIHQLCHSFFRNDLYPSSHFSTATTNTTTTTLTPPPLSSLDQRKQLSLLLATCEHVGMAVTIIQCPSRRHLLCQRFIVVQETKETWSMAMLVVSSKNTKKRKDNGKDDKCSKLKEESISEVAVAPPPSPPPPSKQSSNTSWKIVMVPKRGTVLEVIFPWKDDDDLSNNDQEEYVTVYLET